MLFFWFGGRGKRGKLSSGKALKAPDDPIEWFETLCEIYGRIDHKVDKVTGCWILKDKSAFVHNQVYMRGKNYFLHRVFYAFYKGEITPGLVICHICDQPGCFNPDHLFIATQKENMQDMSYKGRWCNNIGKRYGDLIRAERRERLRAEARAEEERRLRGEVDVF